MNDLKRTAQEKIESNLNEEMILIPQIAGNYRDLMI